MTGTKRNHKIKATRFQKESNNDGTNACFHFLLSIKNDQKWSSTFHFFLSSFHDLTFVFHFYSSTTSVKEKKKSKVTCFSTFHFSLFAATRNDLNHVFLEFERKEAKLVKLWMVISP